MAFAVCSIALGHEYCAFARNLVTQLADFNPDVRVVVGTDSIGAFEPTRQLRTFPLVRHGVFNCYQEKRFALKAALEEADTALFLDADTVLKSPLPSSLDLPPGLACPFVEPLFDHARRFQLAAAAKMLAELADELPLPVAPPELCHGLPVRRNSGSGSRKDLPVGVESLGQAL